MEPQIRYAKTSDGVSIAYYTIGEGIPFIWPSSPTGPSIADHWRVPGFRALIETMSRGASVVTYNPRGFGLSDRGEMDHSCEAMVRDLEAVADATAKTPLILQTYGYGSIPGLVYAARHPERVVALVLLNGIVRSADMSESWRRLLRMAAEDWEYAKLVLVRTNDAGHRSTATLQQLEELFDRATPQAAFLAFGEALQGWDASDVAGSVDVPALVTHYEAQSPHIPLEASRRLAALLPNASFSAFESGGAAEARFTVVRDFLRGVLPDRPAPRAAAGFGTGTMIVLFTDIADSTALTERMGDAAFRAVSRALDDGGRAAIRDAGGAPVEGKVLGDGVMGVFTSAAQAIDAARRCVALGDDLPMHIGLHAGDVISEGTNVYGGAVNIASRICGLCAPGEILVSATVRELARTSADVTFEDRGEQMLKGIEEPVRVFAVREVN